MVAIERADSALAILPLTYISVFLVVRFPNHRSLLIGSGGISHAIDKLTGVYTLIVGPFVDTVAMPDIIYECTSEFALVVIVDDCTFAV